MSYAEDGVIVPVEDLIDNYMPNLKAIYDEYPAYRQFVTAPDGHIYTFPWIEELGAGKESIHSIDCIPWINQEWLDNLGLEMPTNTDEFTNVLRAFKSEDANGNGDPNDEIPMSFIYGNGGENFVSILGSFGYGDNWDHTVVTNDNEVVFTMSQEGYKDGIKWINEMYNEGLIDIEVFTQDWPTYLAKGADKKYGVYFTWDMGNISGFESGDYTDPDNIVSDYTAMPIPALPDGYVNATRTNGFGLDRGRMVITSANKNLELTAMWIDKIYEPLQSTQNNWGTYGDENQQNIFELTKEGTFLQHLPLGNMSPWELRQKTFVGGPLAILDTYYDKYITKPDDAAWRLNVIKDVYVPQMKMDNNFPKVFYSIEDQETLTNIEVHMFEFATTKVAEWIQNGKIDDEWDSYLNDLKTMGLDEWLTIKQTYYDKVTQ
jgi:putative aldouronate transport system substrate-binding protein